MWRQVGDAETAPEAEMAESRSEDNPRRTVRPLRPIRLGKLTLGKPLGLAPGSDDMSRQQTALAVNCRLL